MITILNATPYPISLIGRYAAVCYNSETDSNKQNYARGLACIKAGHGEMVEYPEITFHISEYSIRVFRELFRHRHTTKSQQSTRYVDVKENAWYTPLSIEKNDEAFAEYNKALDNCMKTYKKLVEEFNIPKEDAAGCLPLNLDSEAIIKVNLRELIHIFSVRSCGKAYEEIRQMMTEIKKCILNDLDIEWNTIALDFLKPKCASIGKCTEKNPCGYSYEGGKK